MYNLRTKLAHQILNKRCIEWLKLFTNIYIKHNKRILSTEIERFYPQVTLPELHLCVKMLSNILWQINYNGFAPINWWRKTHGVVKADVTDYDKLRSLYMCLRVAAKLKTEQKLLSENRINFQTESFCI